MGISGPFVGMVLAILAQVSDSVVCKAAMSQGISKYILLFYSNSLSTLILLPMSFIFPRSELPQLSFSIICNFFLLALIGHAGLLLAYAGIEYSSPTLGTAMLNIIPAFTFILALIFSFFRHKLSLFRNFPDMRVAMIEKTLPFCIFFWEQYRMEKLDLKSSSSLAKLMGTVVSITGAFIVTFYRGLPITANVMPSFWGSTHQILFSSHENWILGGFLSAAHAMLAALWYTFQASVLKKYPAVLIVLCFYCFFVSLQSFVVSVIAEDLSSWKLKPGIGFVAVAFSAIIGTVFRYSISMLCVCMRGPLYVSMFKPLAIIAAAIMSVIFLGEALHIGSLVGAIVIVAGFYAFMWGRAKEEHRRQETGVGCLESTSSKEPLLQQ